MSSAGKCLLWLTALTTASLTVTGCNASDGRSAAVTGALSTSSARPSSPAHSPTPKPSHISEPTTTATASPAAHGTSRPQPFVLVLSDGTDVARVAGHDVRFPGPVSDATVSPNGMVIAFVDGLGNIATARLDGTDVRVLTSTDPGVRRTQPTFEDGGSEIVFSERGHDGVWRLKEVAADGHDELTAGKSDPTLEETRRDGGGDMAPSATWFQSSHTESARSVLVFEHRTARGPVKVYVADRNQRGFGASPLLPGRAPAVSPTGDRVAFIGPEGQIHVQPLEGRNRPTQVTWRAHPTGHLAWSPDGRRIVFSTSHDVESVGSAPVRPGHNPVRVLMEHPGVASLGTVRRPTLGTFPSADPVTASLAVSRARFVDGTDVPVTETDGIGVSWVDHVTLLSTDDPSAAAPAAAIAAGGPVLFVRDGRLDPRVRDEILRVLQRPHGFRHGTVDIVGTATDVPESIESELRAVDLRVRRFEPGSAATAAAAAMRGAYTSCVVVSATDLPAVASSVSASNPVLLTDGPTMPPATAAKLDKLAGDAEAPATVYAVGRDAQAAVSASWSGKRAFQIVDVGGEDADSDSLAAVRSLYDAPGRLSVASAADWRGMLIADMVGPALVVDTAHGLSADAEEWLGASRAVMRAVYVFGGSPTWSGTVGQAVWGDRYVERPSPSDITQ